MAAQETLSFVSFVVQTLNSIGEVANDGGLTVKSVMDLVKSIELAAPALKNIKSLPGELATLTDADKAAISAKISSVALPTPQANEVADAILEVSLGIAEFICSHLAPAA